MESVTYLKNIKTTPKKLRMYLPAIKKQRPVDSVKTLYYHPTKAAQILRKAIISAMGNAKHTLKVNEDLLQFKLFTVEEGMRMKRYHSGSRGSAKPFTREYAHIKIIMVVTPGTQAEAQIAPVEKATVKPEEMKNESTPVEAAAEVKKPKARATKTSTKSKVKKTK